MTETYVALLRGIGPANPAMRNDNLNRVAAELGHRNVRTVISSGNLLFESDRANTAALEAEMEAAWAEKLGFTSTTIVRSRERIARLVDAKPFEGLEHGRSSYLLVTFLKHAPPTRLEFPIEPPGRSFRLLGMLDQALFSVTDPTNERTPDVMRWLEKAFGKEISSRTWKTVQRIIAKM